MFTVRIPYIEPPLATQWHPTEATGPLAVLVRGNFTSKADAVAWARLNLEGTPYSIEPIALAEAAPVEVMRDPRCVSCKVQRATTYEELCTECDRHEAQIKLVIAALKVAPSQQLNQRTLARKLGCTAAALNGALWKATHRKLIARAYLNAHEAPSAVTYKLTEAGNANA